jgi:hypothetical protein
VVYQEMGQAEVLFLLTVDDTHAHITVGGGASLLLVKQLQHSVKSISVSFNVLCCLGLLFLFRCFRSGGAEGVSSSSSSSGTKPLAGTHTERRL